MGKATYRGLHHTFSHGHNRQNKRKSADKHYGSRISIQTISFNKIKQDNSLNAISQVFVACSFEVILHGVH